MQSQQHTEHRGPGRPKKAILAKRIRGIVKVQVPTWLPAVKPEFEAPPSRPAWLSIPTPPAKTCQFPMWDNQERVPRPPLLCGAPIACGSWCGFHIGIVCSSEGDSDHA